VTTGEQPTNIVLCSVGTGQSGAEVRDTNVWKIGMAVDRHDHDATKPRQIVFYDASVGASALSVKTILGLAFGYGLADNIRELYTSLARTYNEGDRIYIFGFSRGAFTARSLAGMISELGVIDGRPDSEDLDDLVRAGYKAYRSGPKSNPIAKFHAKCDAHGVKVHKKARIHFVGVWDTVSPYNMPIAEQRDLTYWVIKKLWRPHQDQLTDKMDHAFHALAIDENRLSFTPRMYDLRKNGSGEGMETTVDVDQVWFAGAHSNVGGGYPRQALSGEALEWMMTRAEQHGLRFTEGARAEARRERDASSPIYDPRSGLDVLYRYGPRNIERLCRQAGVRPAIHVSVLNRIDLAAASYGPVNLPADFDVVGYGYGEEQRRLYSSDENEQVARFSRLVDGSAGLRRTRADESWKLIARRRWLLRLSLAYLGVSGFLAVWFYNDAGAAKWYADNSPLAKLGGAIGEGIGFTGAIGTVWGWITSGVLALVPTQFLDDFVKATFLERPSFIVGIPLVGLVLFWRHKVIVRQMKHHGLSLWRDAFQGERLTDGGRRRTVLAPEEPLSFSETFTLPAPPQALVDAISRGRCIAYIGSGLSQPAGYPMWSELSRGLLEWATTRNLLRDSLARSLLVLPPGQEDLVVDTVVSEVADPELLVEYLRNEFASSPKNTDYYEQLRRIGFGAAFTTNYDDLTGSTFEAQGWPVLTPDDAEELLGLASRRSGYVLKLYGTLERPKTIMLSPSDYKSRAARNHFFASFMEGVLSSNTLLFLGAGLGGIENYLEGIPFSPIVPEARHFALIDVRDPAWESRAALLSKRYGIQTLPFTPDADYSQLSHFLEQLADSGKKIPDLQVASEAVPHLTAVELSDIGPFEQVRIPLDAHFNVLLGDNGVGKSTVLRAIAAVLCGGEAREWGGRLIRIGAPAGIIKLHFSNNVTYTAEITRVGSDLTDITVSPRRPLESLELLSLAFPAVRTISWRAGQKPGGLGAPTIDDLIPLVWDRPDDRPDSFRDWIVQLEAEIKDAKDTDQDRADHLKVLREEVFGVIAALTEGIGLAFERVDLGTRQVWVRAQGTVIPLAGLSQGTLGLLGWVGVLCQRLYEIGQPLKAGRALVLLDEVDAHMHPKWQRSVLTLFGRAFENVQLIATTHSPLIIGGLKPEQIQRLERDSDEAPRLSKVEPDMSMGRPDQVLASDLFRLPAGFDMRTEEMIERWHELDEQEDRNADEDAELAHLTSRLDLRVLDPHVAASERSASNLLDALIEDTFGGVAPERSEKLKVKARRLLKEVEREAAEEGAPS
jgi:uncharacterized protein (DUF2235 family)